MKILSALRKKKPPRDFYLALIYKPHKAAAILFEKTESSLVIVSTKEEKLEKELDLMSGEDLVQMTDVVVSSVEGAMPEGELLEKTIFSVPHEWQIEGKITKENLAKLKQVCDALELKAIGFIVSIEAVVNFMQKKEGAPITAIFVEHVKHTVFVYLVKKGDIVEVKSSEAGENFVQTVEKLLLSVESFDTLPQKIILHDYENVEDQQQEFLSHEWKSELNFLHVPQVLILDKGFENEAVINGVASQMGFDVLHDVKAGAVVVDEDEGEGEEEPAESGVALADASEFGFASEHDIAVKTEAQQEGESKEHAEEQSYDPDEHANIVAPKIHDPFEEKEAQTDASDEDLGEDNEKHGEKDVKRDDIPDNRVTLVDTVKGMIPLGLLKGLKGKGAGGVMKKAMNLRLILILIGLVGLIALLAYMYFSFFLKAEVIVFADSKVVEANETVTFAEDEETSFDDKTIKLATVTESIDVSKNRDVTGTKETGEKAKGEVILYNKTEKPKTFEKGAVIVSNNDLEFVLLDEVKIASTSSFSTSFSSGKAKIEASKFGKEYNLPSNTNFTVKGESSANFIAKNDGAFSGGSKKEIDVVSKKDLAALEEEAQKGVGGQALTNATNKLGSDVLIIKTPLEVSLEEKKFSKKEGEEAKSVSLTGRAVYTFGTYAKNDLTEFVKQMAKDDVPDNYALIADQSDMRVDDLKVDEEAVTGKLVGNAVFAPTIETSKMLSNLKGKRLSSAQEYIKQTQGVSDYKIIRKNVLPIFPSFLPFNVKNITITVKTDG